MKTTSYRLGAKSLDVSALLEDKRSVTASDSLDLSDDDRSALAHSGLLNTVTEDCDNPVGSDVSNCSEVSLVMAFNIEEC